MNQYSPKAIRTAAGVTQLIVAATCGTTQLTVAKYEAAREAVTQPRRARLDEFYRELAERVDLQDIA